MLNLYLGSREVQTIDGKKGLQHMGRCIRIASYIPLSPPPATPIINIEEMMALLFARDVKYVHSCILSDSRDLEEVIAAVGKTLNSFISEFMAPDLKPSTKTSTIRISLPCNPSRLSIPWTVQIWFYIH